MPPRPLYDLERFENAEPIFSLDEIRKVNPQRHAMEHLSGILLIDRDNHGIVGFKDVTDDEFWVTGHMPGFPLMPGVVLCECAAQLAGFYARKYNLVEAGDYLGFGGMNNVRFRYPVFPGCRLLLMAQTTLVKPRRRAEFDFQGFVEGRMVFSGEMIGVPIDHDQKL